MLLRLWFHDLCWDVPAGWDGPGERGELGASGSGLVGGETASALFETRAMTSRVWQPSSSSRPVGSPDYRRSIKGLIRWLRGD